ncbi:sensor histidine kinase [Silvibacterium acidisoli]|uniref:sensor histidine kinase n=1 Tax=Acidobacteriaceae bacterium ZG23-2 TaxID=2883246 RepID=UPI00406C4322
MASSYRRRSRSNPGRDSLSFERKLQLFCALMALPAFALLAILLFVLQLSAAAIASILSISALALLLAIAAFMDQVMRPLQTLANVVAALREEDYSFRARGARRDGPFGDLAIEINALADIHQSQRLASLEAAALFRRVIAELDAPVLAFDHGNRLRLINPAAEKLFAVNSARDLGRTVAELKLEHLLDQPDEGVLVLDGQRQAGPPSRWMIRHSDFRQQGVPHRLLLLSDVSAALREEERVAWRRLIRVLGHEISNSLAPIKSIAGSLRTRLPQGEQALPDFERGLGVIEGRAEALNRFVQAYRQLAQLPAPVRRRVQVRPLLDRVVGVETRIEVKLATQIEAELVADPDQLEQLLINLVRNAVESAISAYEDALSEGRQAAQPAVKIDCEELRDVLLIRITDNGIGLTNPGNLFVPFYTTKKSGSGVGLALARQIAEGHGGTVELHNRTDATGCEAELRIPLPVRMDTDTERESEAAAQPQPSIDPAPVR